MANEFYNHDSGVPQSISRAMASEIRSELDKIGGGLDKLPSLAKMATNSAGFSADMGGVNAFVLTGVPSVVALADGMEFRFRAANATTGPATLNVNSLGAKPVVRNDGSPIDAGDIFAGQAVTLTYDAVNGRFQYFSAGAAFIAAAAAHAANAEASASAATAQAEIATGEASSAFLSASAAQAAQGQAEAARDQAKDYRDQAAGLITGVTSVAGRTGAVTLVAADISNSTATGRAVLTAADAAAARTALGLSSDVTAVAGTTVTAVTRGRYRLDNASMSTGALPASPANFDTATFFIGNGRSDNVVDRNGQLLMGLPENLVMDVANIPYSFIFFTGKGWVLA